MTMTSRNNAYVRIARKYTALSRVASARELDVCSIKRYPSENDQRYRGTSAAGVGKLRPSGGSPIREDSISLGSRSEFFIVAFICSFRPVSRRNLLRAASPLRRRTRSACNRVLNGSRGNSREARTRVRMTAGILAL